MLINNTERITVASSKAKPRVFWTQTKKEGIAGWLFLSPVFICILVLGVFPVLFSLFLSFCEWNLVGGLSSIKFVGLDNFKMLFEDDKFYMALKNNLMYTAVTVPIGLCLALILSVLIHSRVFGQSYFKIAFFIPYISSITALGAIWSALYHPSLGPINQFLIRIGITNPPKWLADTHFSLVSIMIIAIWAALGYQIIIFIAGLTNIPEELYEAADMDGASSVQQFFRITLPLLGPTTSFLFITTLMSSFKVFDLISFLTGGGPNDSSTVLVYRIYEEGFQNFRMGYASAISWALFVIIGIVTLISYRVQMQPTEE
ncbi:sugar ABC transporter permease [Paenibacillus pectinilyticus]|uniref:Sugar ABC transporter permease n=1 Tax=Paenibacillus pectinilyticus TaxID=512399 RepID=A0A1C0ZTS1_9BACL|nr:sugar ABC transporter permease [Paenibacillus pectinilyticus]OCT11480.1 sugar ABC transporter permease [Paenibacillus pectinilyticus]